MNQSVDQAAEDGAVQSPAVDPAADAAASAPPDSTGAPPPKLLFLTVFPSIMLPMFLAVADQTIVATALPTIASDLGERP